MSGYIGVNNVARKIKTPSIGVGGIARNVKTGYIGVNGVARKFYQGGKQLDQIAKGSIVYLPENGVNVPFIVVKHNYQSDHNTNRTLLARQYCVHAVLSNRATSYQESTIRTWVAQDYYQRFNSNIQTLIGFTSFYVNGSTLMADPIFIFSKKELDGTGSGNDEALNPGTHCLTPRNENNELDQVWTRTKYRMNYSFYCVYNGAVDQRGSDGYDLGIQPIFTLPNATLFNESNIIIL